MKLYERETWDGQKFLTTNSNEGFPVGMKNGDETFKGIMNGVFCIIIGCLDIGLPVMVLGMGLNKWDLTCTVCLIIMLCCWCLTIKKLFF